MSKPKTAKDIQIPDEVLFKLLTPSEIRMLKNRFSIVQFLDMGLSIRQTAYKVKVGTDTVVRVSKMMEKNNLRLINSRKIKQISPTSWIFGKSNE